MKLPIAVLTAMSTLLAACSGLESADTTSTVVPPTPSTTTSTVPGFLVEECHSFAVEFAHQLEAHEAYQDSLNFGIEILIGETVGTSRGGEELADRSGELAVFALDLQTWDVPDERLREALNAYVLALEKKSEAWARLSVSFETNDTGDLAEAEALMAQADALERRAEGLMAHPEFDFSGLGDELLLSEDAITNRRLPIAWIQFLVSDTPEIQDDSRWVLAGLCGTDDG